MSCHGPDPCCAQAGADGNSTSWTQGPGLQKALYRVNILYEYTNRYVSIRMYIYIYLLYQGIYSFIYLS